MGDVDQVYDWLRTGCHAHCHHCEVDCTTLRDGLVFGLQCDQGVVHDGTLVESWTDQVGGRIFKQLDPAKKLKIHETPWPNGQPRIYADGQQYLRILDNNIIHLPAKPWSIGVYANFYGAGTMTIYQNIIGPHVTMERHKESAGHTFGFYAVGPDQFTVDDAVTVGTYACVVGLDAAGAGKAYVDGVDKTRPPDDPQEDYPIQFIGRMPTQKGPYLACLLIWRRLLSLVDAETFMSESRACFGYP